MTGYSNKTDMNRSDSQANPSTSYINGTSPNNTRRVEGIRRDTMKESGESSTSRLSNRSEPNVFKSDGYKQSVHMTSHGQVPENVIVIDVPPDTETGISSKESPTENRKKKMKRKKGKGNNSPNSSNNRRSFSNDGLIQHEVRGSDRSVSPASPRRAPRSPRGQPQSFTELDISVQSPSTAKPVQQGNTVRMIPDQDANVIEKSEDLAEMILVQRKKKNKVKTSPPDSYKSDQGKQIRNKNNYQKSPKRNDKSDSSGKRDRKHPKSKTESTKSSLPNPASFDMENDFPPLSGGQLSPTNRRENQVLYTDVIQKQKDSTLKDLEQSSAPSREYYEQSNEEFKVPEPEKEESKVFQTQNDNFDETKKYEERTENQESIQNEPSSVQNSIIEESQLSEIPKNEKAESKETSLIDDQSTEKSNESQRAEETEKSEDSYKTTTASYILTQSADDPKVLNKTKVNDPKFVVQNNPNERNSGNFRPRNQQYQNSRRRNELQNPYMSNEFISNGYMNGGVPIQSTSFQPNYQAPMPPTMYPSSAYYFAPNTPAYAGFLPVAPHHPSGFIPDQSYIPIQGPFYSANGNPIVFSNGRTWEYVGGNSFNPESFGMRPPFPLKFPIDPSNPIQAGPAYPQMAMNPNNQESFNPQMNNAEERIPVEEMFPVKEFITRSSSVPLPQSMNDSALGNPNMPQQNEESSNQVIPNVIPSMPNSMLFSNPIPLQMSNIPERVDTLSFSPELQKVIREAFALQPDEGIFYVYTVDAQSNHKRQFRCFMHSQTPVKFSELEFPVVLEPTNVGGPNEHSPGGYYYVSRKRVPSKGPRSTELVTQFQPIRAYSAIVPPDYRIAPLPYYYRDLIRIPEADPRVNQDPKLLANPVLFSPIKNDAQ